MLRDLKFLRRNSTSSKNPNSEEIENVPLNPRHSLGPQIGSDSSRPPLSTIQEPKGKVELEGGVSKVTKSYKTPTKPKARYSDSTLHRTPEKHGTASKYRFGWSQKGDTSLNNSELREEGKNDVGLPRTMGYTMTTPRSTRTIGRANSSVSECNSTQNTPTKSVSKPPNPGFSLTNGGSSRALVNGGSRMTNFAPLSKGSPNAFNSSNLVNTVDVPCYVLKEDPAFWMEHSVQVFIRVRPLNNMEKSINGFNRCLKQDNSQCITWIGQPETRFTFDHIACEQIDQETVFKVVGLPIVENCLSGYNSCMFAYGQTGSGKTYTMLGDTEELELRPSKDRGLTPRIFEFLFARIRAEEESRKDERLTYYCKCSFLEIYNEQITDLLDPSSTNLQVREDIKKGVYVENLSELEVQSVGDILKLLSQGCSNRRVGATNMNSESSRSHSVFTCVIESRWEKDSTSNFRFARLNLVDLAGSERQKSSGAEGERLKEAANINKSLSTLGLVIMALVDVAHGKTKHVPYRDSRLTFLLQDSLGGNSKTTIIANISPSICCAAETYNTLKFAQRVKLIKNNAVVNEDSSGDVAALQHQIRLLKEELLNVKRQNVSRTLSFGPSKEDNDSYSTGNENLSSKQLKSLEVTLSGAFRREQMAETAIKQLEAEIEQLNHLVSQREEDTMRSKMMLKFREDKIQRMESLVTGLIPSDTYLVQENNALSEEIQLLRDNADKNTEVTQFAIKNIRLTEQLKRFQEFYEDEGERERLLAEISQLRNQLTSSLDGILNQQNQQEVNDLTKENELLRIELKETLHELDESKNNLNCCLEKNEKLRREIDDLRVSLTCDGESNKEIDMEIENLKTKHTEEMLNLQLELDILKIILREEKSYRYESEKKTQILNRDLELSQEKILFINNQYEDIKEELKNAQSVIEALESQQILLINEIEDFEKSNLHFQEEITSLKEKIYCQESKEVSSDSPLQAKLKKMHDSLEKAKELNQRYQTDRVFQESNEEEMDEIRKQVEGETAQVIVCLQEELSVLEQEVENSKLKEIETSEKLEKSESEMKILKEEIDSMSQENRKLCEIMEEKEQELEKNSEEWRVLASEIESILVNGNESLEEAVNQVDEISDSFVNKESWGVSQQLARLRRYVTEKDLAVEELNGWLEDVMDRKNDMENMLRSLRGAALVMSEAHEKECNERDKEIICLKRMIKRGNDELEKRSNCATVAFLVVKRLSELNSCYLERLDHMDLEIRGLIEMNMRKDDEIDEVVKENESLKVELQEKIEDEENKMLSLKGVKAEMDRLDYEKKEALMSEKVSLERIKSLETRVLSLQMDINRFGEECDLKIGDVDEKLQVLKQKAEESCDSWIQQKKLLEAELNDSTLFANQKATEAICILGKFEEAQNTIKEADFMVNELMISNEALKLQVKDLKKNKLNSTNELKRLEVQSKEDLITINTLLVELENMVSESQNKCIENSMLLASDIVDLKSQFGRLVDLVRSWLEDVWSEIISKDCALSVLHLCHLGILLENVTGLNAENGLLNRGLCESNSVISELRDHNIKSRQELDVCRTVKGKLLMDIKNSFDRVTKKEHEAEELSLKVVNFDKKISDLKLQEELMLERFNHIGSELAKLMTELDLSNRSLVEQERLHKEKEENWRLEEEKYVIEQVSKDFEVLILSMELKEMGKYFQVLENLKKNVVICSVDASINELMLVEKESEFVILKREVEELLLEINKRDSIIEDIEQDNESLKHDLGEKMEGKALLESDYEKLLEELKMKEMSSHQISVLDEQNKLLQESICFLETESNRLENELETKNLALENLDCVKEENRVLKEDHNALFQQLHDKNVELEKSLNITSTILMENQTLQEKINLLENCITNLQTDLNMNIVKCVDSAKDMFSEKALVLENMLQRISIDAESTLKFTQDIESIELLAKEVISENNSLQNELLRKEEIHKGLLFDLSLLQERASSSIDKDNEIKELESCLYALEDKFEIKSRELDEAIAKSKILEAQVLEKSSVISALELDILEGKSLLKQNVELVREKRLIEEELEEIKEAKNSLENELFSHGEMSEIIKVLKSDLAVMREEREEYTLRISNLNKDLANLQALAEQNEAIAVEAREIAEIERNHAEDKDKEVKLLERSVEALEDTVNVLENKVEIIKSEAEKQRFQREELELELHAIKQQMQNLETSDSDFNRLVDEKEKKLEEAFQRIQILEKEISIKDKEINQCKTHISELNIYANAQASEYKQKFKALEAMAEEVKHDVGSTTYGSSGKSERNPSSSKSRGSSSPFKCIGGLVQQIKLDKEDELSGARYRIEELEALAANRQKQIFMLNARLATAESMTHDVIRDLLGLKCDINNYASKLDNQEVQMLIDKAQMQKVDGLVKEEEYFKLKQELSEFIEERKGWLEEIERKQAEMVAIEVKLEKLRERERLLLTENDLLKMENVTHKKREMELEMEVKKLSGQQNLQQRIHHHAKIKEENNALKSENDGLSSKLRKTEGILVRVREELAQFRQANGRSSYINFDDKLKDLEEEKVQLAQKLLSLCTSILKVAGITKPKSEISLQVAEEALEQLKNKIFTLEDEIYSKNTKRNKQKLRSSSSPRGDEYQSSYLSPLDR